MNKTKILPKARKHNLIIQNLVDETLVYDLNDHQAHCLNKTSLIVWENCDGKTTIQQVSKILQDKLNLSNNENVILLALKQLSKTNLLEEKITNYASLNLSRRTMIRLGFGAALALPLITSLVIPKAANAGSLLSSGDSCGQNSECASNSCISNICA